jgi:hypothetical protein
MATVPTFFPVAALRRLTTALWGSQVVAAGQFWTLNRPIFAGIQNTAQANFAANTPTAILWDGEIIDRDGQHSTSSLTSRIVFPTIGWYLVSYSLTWPSNATGTRRTGAILQNGTTGINGGQSQCDPGTFNSTCPPIPVQATVSTDYIEITGQHDASSSIAPTVSGQFRSIVTVWWVGS